MTRLQAAIGGIIVPTALILSVAWFAPEILGKPAAAPAVAESQVLLSPTTEVDSTLVTPVLYKKPPEAAPGPAIDPPPATAAALPATPTPSPCERHLRPVAVPKPDGVLDRLLDDKLERAVAEQTKQMKQARNCYRAERGGDGR